MKNFFDAGKKIDPFAGELVQRADERAPSNTSKGNVT
jgi:hypothetical protein